LFFLLILYLKSDVESHDSAMGFGDLKAKAGQQALNDYLADKSYIEG
jgi:hypothetical protein